MGKRGFQTAQEQFLEKRSEFLVTTTRLKPICFFKLQGQKNLKTNLGLVLNFTEKHMHV